MSKIPHQDVVAAMLGTSFKMRLLRQWEAAGSVNQQPFNEREILTLQVLSEFGAQTEAGLARILGLAPSSVSELVRKLIEYRVVEKRETGGDGRQKPVGLTNAGEE